jgi:XRE family transcriptional regulator of biofilm formation
MTLGEQLRELRLSKGVSVNKLAKIAQVAQPSIAGIEAGKTPNPSCKTMYRISRVLGVSTDYWAEHFNAMEDKI